MVRLIWWQSPLSNNPKIGFFKNKMQSPPLSCCSEEMLFAHLEDINVKRLSCIFEFGWKALLFVSVKWIHVIVQLPQDIYENKMFCLNEVSLRVTFESEMPH